MSRFLVPPAPDLAQVAALAERLGEREARVASGELALLHVPAGGCGGCALELALLASPPYDIERFGLRLVSTPRRANVLLATGAFARNAAGALRRAWEAMPGPRFLVALGDCASGADPFGAETNYALVPGGVRAAFPVDLAIRGSPPAPEAILYGLLTLRAAVLSRS